MKRLVLLRNYQDERVTLGDLLVYEGKKCIFKCKTLELPWKENKSKVSCIPPGTYTAKFEYSNAFKQKLFELKGVSDRSEIKIHVANFAKQLLGCIGVGAMIADIDKDGIPDLASSRITLAKLHDEILPQESIQITIVNV